MHAESQKCKLEGASGSQLVQPPLQSRPGVCDTTDHQWLFLVTVEIFKEQRLHNCSGALISLLRLSDATNKKWTATLKKTARTGSSCTFSEPLHRSVF